MVDAVEAHDRAPQGEQDSLDWARLRQRADEASFRRIFTRHHKAVYNFAFRRLGNWSAAEEVTQATFMALWRRANDRRIDKLRGGSARGLILGMARYECLNHHRSTTRRDQLTERLGSEAATRPDTHDAERWLRAEDTMAAIHEAMDVLTDDQRDVVELVAWSELSISDAAACLGVAEGTVKSRLSRARTAMADTRAASLLGATS